jgi:hypothetical protein
MDFHPAFAFTHEESRIDVAGPIPNVSDFPFHESLIDLAEISSTTPEEYMVGLP